LRDLLNELMSVRFWVAVVVVGLLVNLAAMWLNPRLERIGGALSGTIRRRNQARADRRAAMVARVAADPSVQVIVQFNEMRMRLISITLLVFGFTLGQISIGLKFVGVFSRSDTIADQWLAPSCLALAALVLSLAFYSFLEATRLNSILLEAGKTMTAHDRRGEN